MNSPLLYQWIAVIDKRFPELGKWQRYTLALFVYGVTLAQGCRLYEICQSLTDKADTSTLERRLQRWLANDRLQIPNLQEQWVKWVLEVWGKAPLLVLVDETKLSNHLSVMMVGIAYHKSAIPLVWRAYRSQDYPEEGQVALLNGLLDTLRAWIPADQALLVLADRGLGTSPTWHAHLTETRYPYGLRVQASTHMRFPGQPSQPLRRLASYGQIWSGRAEVFKKAGWQSKWVYLVWELGYKEPLCIVSNVDNLSPHVYSCRFHHEASFCDLKSDGFNWQKSRVWLPTHAERLLLVLAIAMFWVFTEGTKVVSFYPLKQRQKRLSLFRLGRDYLMEKLASLKETCLEFHLAPDTPYFKSVVP